MTQFIQAANHWTGREGYTPKYLIVHGTAGGSSAVAIAQYFSNASTQASAHYVIGTDGLVVQCVSENDAAWANGPITSGADAWWANGPNPNLISIAVEHCKPATDNSSTLTDAQKQASFQLIKDICTRWNIPMRWADASGGITGHYSMDPVNRARCPGVYPWDELFTFLNKEESTMLELTDTFGGHFEDIGGGRWRCKDNGFVVQGENLNFYRKSFGALRLPVTNEIINIVANHPEIAVQAFEGGTQVYDPANFLDNPGTGPCYVMHTNHPFALQLQKLVTQQQLDDAINKINDLTNKLNVAQQPAIDKQAINSDIASAMSLLQDAFNRSK